MTPTFIQAVPWIPERTKRAVGLMRETNGLIVWDREFSSFETYLDLLRAVGYGPAIMLEDDVDLVPNWREQVEEEIAKHPDDVIQMFTIRMNTPPQTGWGSPGSGWCR